MPEIQHRPEIERFAQLAPTQAPQNIQKYPQIQQLDITTATLA
jgi:hypothetical protein